MDEVFHEGVPKELLAELGQRQDGPGLLLLGAQLALGAAGGALLVVAATPAAFASGLLLSAVFQLSTFAILHECVHRTAFRSGWLNGLGAWLASLFQLMAPPLHRAFHFAHHRHTHDTALDPELGGMELMARWPRGAMWLVTMSGLPVLLARLLLLVVTALGGARFVPFVQPQRRREVWLGSLGLLALHAAFVAAALALDPRLLRLYLAVPLAHALLSLYITAEHRGLPGEGSILERTRSLDVGPGLRFLLWNMPFHAEHHAYPAVPFHALPRLRQALAPQLRHRGGLVGFHWRSGADQV